MKLKVILLAFFLPACFLLKAQKMQYGLTGALNLSSISGTGMSSKYQTGFEAGAFASIPFYNKISIQPELLYSFLKVGRTSNFSTYYVDGSRESSKMAFNLAYVSIPVSINYHLSEKFSINAGPQYSFLVYSNEDLLYYHKAFKNNDYGIKGGIKFAPSPELNLFAGFYYGLANISAVDNGDNNYKWQNRQLQIGINVALFTGK